jgi:hypothetical protein
MSASAHMHAGKAPAPEWGGAAPVWWSLMRGHGQRPLHALLRGGGQINGDKVFEVPYCSKVSWCLLLTPGAAS